MGHDDLHGEHQNIQLTPINLIARVFPTIRCDFTVTAEHQFLTVPGSLQPPYIPTMATINFQGKPLHTNGELPAVGSHAPDFKLVNGKLKDVTLATYANKNKILNIVPSLDTPTCAASARMFNQKAANFSDTVVLVISADLPFAQCRFCTTEGLKNILPLSSFRSNFAVDYGVKLTDSILAGLTARAVIIIDKRDTVIYAELVNELANEPDYDSVLQALAAAD